MTWVVGVSGPFGYGALYSDVQVTLRDGSTRDMVQKAYPITEFIAAGFAGSVKIGFMAMQSLKDRLTAPGRQLGTYAWDPVSAAKSWAAVAPSVFAEAELEEQRLGSQILMVAAHPADHGGIGSRVFVVRFCAPEFKPQFMLGPMHACGIGTGASVREYKRSIKPLLRHTSGLMRAEFGRRGAWGNQLAHSISQAVGRTPRTGIGRLMNTILVSRSGFMFGKTDQTYYQRDGINTIYNIQLLPRAITSFFG